MTLIESIRKMEEELRGRREEGEEGRKREEEEGRRRVILRIEDLERLIRETKGKMKRDEVDFEFFFLNFVGLGED